MKFQTLLCSDGNESFIAHHLDKRSHDDNLTNSKISAIRTRLIFYFILVLRQAMKDDVEGNYKKENEKKQANYHFITLNSILPERQVV